MARSSLSRWVLAGLAGGLGVAGILLFAVQSRAPRVTAPAIPAASAKNAVIVDDAPEPVAPVLDVPQLEELAVIKAIVPGTQFHPGDWPPLPDLARPPAERIDVLRTRAEAGDHKAACQLAWDLATCTRVRRDLAKEDRDLTRMDPADLYAANKLGGLDYLTTQARRCDGMPEDEALQWRMTRQAARAGLVAAIEHYAFLPQDLYLVSRLPAAEIRRILAERDSLLLVAAIAGSPLARQSLGLRFDVFGRALALDFEQGLDADERALVRIFAGGGRAETAEANARIEAMRAHFAARQAALSLEQRRRMDQRPLVSACEETYMPAPVVRERVDWRTELGMRP